VQDRGLPAELAGERLGGEPALEDGVRRAVVERALVPGLARAAGGGTGALPTTACTPRSFARVTIRALWSMPVTSPGSSPR